MEKKYSRLPLNEKGELVKGEYSLKSPGNLVLISQKKTGKTLTAANKSKILIADCERGTRDFGWPVNNKVDISKYDGKEEFKQTNKYGWIPMGLFQLVDELKAANNMVEYWKLFAELDEKADKNSYDTIIKHINTMPFPILAMDTITSFIEVSNSAALYEYNLSVKPENRKNDIKRADEYGGVRYTRRKFEEIKNFVEQNAAPFIIYFGHIAEKKKVFKKDENDISTIDIDLEGVQSKIFTVRSSAIGIFRRDGDGCFFDFNKKDESDLGNRSGRLSNKIVKIADFIASTELEKGTMPKTYWSEIYPELQGLDVVV